MKRRSSFGLKLGVFASVMAVLTALLFFIFGQYTTGATTNYSAVFSDVSGARDRRLGASRGGAARRHCDRTDNATRQHRRRRVRRRSQGSSNRGGAKPLFAISTWSAIDFLN